MAAEPGCDLSNVWSSLRPNDVREFRRNECVLVLRKLAAGMCGIGIKSTGACGVVDITWKLDFFDINNTCTNWLFGVSLDAHASDDASNQVNYHEAKDLAASASTGEMHPPPGLIPAALL